MDKPILDWKRKLRGMDPQSLTDAWSAKAKSDLSWTQEVNFHVAVAERMKQLGNMAIDIEDDTRRSLCLKANEILARLQAHLSENPKKMAEIEKMVKESDEYHQTYGTRTARYYMYEQGMIDLLGDRCKSAG